MNEELCSLLNQCVDITKEKEEKKKKAIEELKVEKDKFNNDFNRVKKEVISPVVEEVRLKLQNSHIKFIEKPAKSDKLHFGYIYEFGTDNSRIGVRLSFIANSDCKQLFISVSSNLSDIKNIEYKYALNEISSSIIEKVFFKAIECFLKTF